MTVELEIAIIGLLITLLSVVVAAFTLRHMHKKELRERDDKDRIKAVEEARKQGAFDEWQEGIARQMESRRKDIENLRASLTTFSAEMSSNFAAVNDRLNNISNTVSELRGIIAKEK